MTTAKMAKRQHVVDERRTGAPTDREESEPFQDEPGSQHDHNRSSDKDRVELLPGIELVDDPRGVSSQRRSHLTSSLVHTLMRRRSRPHLRSPRTEKRDENRERKYDAAPHVDVGHERSTTDHVGQARESTEATPSASGCRTRAHWPNGRRAALGRIAKCGTWTDDQPRLVAFMSLVTSTICQLVRWIRHASRSRGSRAAPRSRE